MTAIAILLLLASLYVVINQTQTMFRVTIDPETFSEQLEKLIKANNIDRAIKLCNSVPNAFAAIWMKRLLVLADRPQELELAFQEVNLLAQRQIRRKNRGGLIENLILMVIWITMFATILVSSQYGWISTICIGVTILMNMLSSAIGLVMSQRLEQNILVAGRLKNLLLRKAGYIPPQHRPIPMTEAEVAQWREEMDAFNQEIMEARKTAADTRSAQEIYDEKAGVDGVLPKL